MTSIDLQTPLPHPPPARFGYLYQAKDEHEVENHLPFIQGQD